MNPEKAVCPSSFQCFPSSVKRTLAADESSAKAKIKLKKKQKFNREGDENLEQGVTHAIGRLDAQQIADYATSREKRLRKDLSVIELEDLCIPGQGYQYWIEEHATKLNFSNSAAVNAIYSTTDWHKQRTVETLPEFLERYGSSLLMSKDRLPVLKYGAPHTIIVTAAGLRAADIARALRIFETRDNVVAKLFAKHKKLATAVEYVKHTRMCIGVGTPRRLIDLFDSGALFVQNLERIVVDCSHLDRKNRSILDITEIRQPLIQLLNKKEIMDRYGTRGGALSLLFF